jgi:NADH dehydrogenase
MRVVVAGGTGFIGRRVVAELLKSTSVDEVVVTSREPDAHDPGDPRVRMVQAFAGDPLSLAKAMTGADVLVQAIQFPNHPVEDPSRGRTYMEVDGRGTRVAAQVARAVGVRRMVYVSGAGAGEGRPQPWFRAKDLAETAIRESGMEYAILRPSWVYGPGDRSMSRFVLFCRYLPVVPMVGDGQTPVYPLHVDDLARAVAACALREDAKNTVLSVGGPQRLTMDEVVGAVQKVLGTHRPLLHHPVKLMKVLTLPMQLLPNPWLSPSAVDFVTQSVEIDPAPAMAFLGTTFRTLDEGLRGYLRQ